MSDNNIFIDDSTTEDRVIWSTEKVNMLTEALDQGIQIKHAPFWEGDPQWKKGNINFDYTLEEIDDIKKCSRDIVYFTNKYCNVMTDEGICQIELRDYQEDMLRHFVANRFSIVLAARQIGKCLSYNTKIRIKEDDIEIEVLLGDYLFSKLEERGKLTRIQKLKRTLYELFAYLTKSNH